MDLQRSKVCLGIMTLTFASVTGCGTVVGNGNQIGRYDKQKKSDNAAGRPANDTVEMPSQENLPGNNSAPLMIGHMENYVFPIFASMCKGPLFSEQKLEELIYTVDPNSSEIPSSLLKKRLIIKKNTDKWTAFLLDEEEKTENVVFADRFPRIIYDAQSDSAHYFATKDSVPQITAFDCLAEETSSGHTISGDEEVYFKSSITLNTTSRRSTAVEVVWYFAEDVTGRHVVPQIEIHRSDSFLRWIRQIADED